MITIQNYKEELKGLCAVEISGEGCANCISLMPVLKALTDARGDIVMKHIEASPETMDLLAHYEVDRVPTILLTDNGEVFAKAIGYQPEEILELWLDAKIQEHNNNLK